jgi:outer membrane protein OmpA-like peptidoglycan-associated protein
MKNRHLKTLAYFSLGLALVLSLFIISTQAGAEYSQSEKQMLEDKAQKIQDMFSPQEAKVRLDHIGNMVITLSGLNFDFGKSSLKSYHHPLLTSVQKAIQMFPDRKIMVTGHTDSVGDSQFNKRLSLERARTVGQYLDEELGIPADRITIKGAGESEPIASNATVQGRRLNRRIDITLMAP